MPYEFVPQTIPLLLAGLLEGAVGFVLATRGRGRPANLALGLFFLVRGQREILSFVAAQASDVPTWYAWVTTGQMSALADGVFLLFLGAAFAPRAWQPRWTLRAWPYVGFSILAAVLIAIEPALFIDQTPLLGCTGVQPVVCPDIDTQAGPLFLVDSVTELATALVPLALFLHAIRGTAPAQWRAAMVLATAVSLSRLYGMVRNTATWFATGMELPADVYGWSSLLYVRIDLALFAIAALYALLAAGRLDAARGRASRTFAWTVLATIALGVLVAIVLADDAWLPTRSLIGGLMTFVVPLVVAYAMLRHDILGLDLRVRWTIRRGTVAAVFVGVFVVASQIAQNVFSASYGMLWGGVITGIMLVGIAPMQRVAERMANAAAPELAPEAPRNEKEHAYRNALRIAYRDRTVTPQEEVQLAHLAEQLGIGGARAVELRQEVERELRTA